MIPLKRISTSQFNFVTMSQYFKIGKFAASHGLTGELVLVHSLGKKTSLKGLETIFIEQTKDNFIPYFIQNTSIKNDAEVYIKLEGIDSKEVARKLTPKEAWLSEEDFNKHAAKAAPIALLGFNLIDGDTDLGEIIEVIEQPHQVLCTIMYKGKEAMVPIHGENLIKMDTKKKKVYVEVPEGLLEIYE
jgi:16S rRNA processing protein RimM